MKRKRGVEEGSGSFAGIAEAIEDIKAGRMLIVVDDEDRENEGDLVIAAEKVTASAINFLAKHARGLICVPMTAERLDELGLGPMVASNTAKIFFHAARASARSSAAKFGLTHSMYQSQKSPQKKW